VTLCATTVRRAHDPPFATQWRRRRQCPRLRHWVGTRNAIGPPPGLRYVDAQLDAQDAKDRAELVEREVKLQAAQKVTEQIETMKKQTEALAKLAERKP